MSEQKLRRKSFIVSMGALTLGWMGLRAASGPTKPARAASLAGSSQQLQLKKEPRAVQFPGRTL